MEGHAADRFAELLRVDPGREASRRHHEPVPDITIPRAPDLQESLGDGVSEGESSTANGEPSHQWPSRWGRGAVRAASWTWSEHSAPVGHATIPRTMAPPVPPRAR